MVGLALWEGCAMRIRDIAIAGVSLLSLTTPAFAQETADAQDEADAKDIVVTGTLIRGIAPGGSQAIAVGQDKIESLGAVNTSDLIASVPQAGNFLGFVGVRGSSNFSLAVNRPSLRYLGSTSASGASTLLLLDGHRMPGMGILQSSADLDAISAGAIERVDIVTDGGSSTYGSDAVGGVMNFITRKRIDGIEAKGNIGFADNYTAYNLGLSAGVNSETVSAYITYDFSKHDDVYGADLDWSQSRDWVNNVPADSACAVGNIRVGTTTYALPGLVAGLGNRCDNTELLTFYPTEEKHSALASVSFDPGGSVSFAVKAYYVNRKNTSNGGVLGFPGGTTVTSANPFAAPILASIPGSPASGTFTFNLSPALGNSTLQQSDMESWGITPTMKWNFGGGWQVNAMFNYGVGNNRFVGEILNAAPITAAIAAGTFNPFNLTAAGNATALATARDQFAFGRAKHELVNPRAIIDGPLFTLPAGEVKAAIGAEYLKEKYTGNNSRNLTAAGITTLADRTASRDIYSVFGELNIPLMGNGSGPFHSFTISASGRYDKYSDFGSTFNPKIGVNIEPVEWLALRGNWGKAFQAPGISDIALSGATTGNVLPIASRPFTNPAVPTVAGRTNLVAMGGTISPLEPQRAKTWSIGFDVKPPASGFAAGLTYYNIDFKGVIGILPISDPTTYYRDFPASSVIFTAGNAAMQAFFNSFGATNAAATLAQLPGGNFDSVYGVLDSRTQNLARIKTSGLDFYVRYNHETSFGSIYADIAGNRVLKFDRQSGPTSAVVDILSLNTTKLRFGATLGANVGDLRAQVTWNHSQGYGLTPVASTLNQASVGSFNLFNLFFQYKVPGDSAIAKDLAFTLNVDNVLDKDPPLFRGADNSLFGVRNGFTIGRLIKLGVSKKF
jgi:iron complex outermembrane receptor protein